MDDRLSKELVQFLRHLNFNQLFCYCIAPKSFELIHSKTQWILSKGQIKYKLILLPTFLIIEKIIFHPVKTDTFKL